MVRHYDGCCDASIAEWLSGMSRSARLVVVAVVALQHQGRANACSFEHGAMLLHFSKSSGTQLCRAARESACKTSGTNCATRMLQGGPWWLPQSAKAPSGWHQVNFQTPSRIADRGCVMRRKVYATSSSFHAVESTLHNGHLCDGFYSVALFRDPIRRLESQSRELKRWGLIPKGVGCDDYPALREFAWPVYDNYHIRALLGEAVYTLPLGAINVSHLALASYTLSQFDAVILSEAADVAERVQKLLGMEGGFASPTAYKGANNVSGRQPMRKKPCVLSAENMERARADNEYDLALFEVANLVVQLSLKKADSLKVFLVALLGVTFNLLAFEKR